MSKTRIQLRGICPVCGKQHATKDGHMVAHGYTVQWSQQVNGCSGEYQPHFGTEEGRATLARYIENLEKYLAKLPELIEKQTDRREKSRLQGALHAIPHAIKDQTARLSAWKPAELVEVDVEVEEAEQRKARQAAADEKKAAKEKAAAEKAAKAAEREAKAKAKWDAICAENTHQIICRDNVVVEWTAAYENRQELERGHTEKVREYLATISNEDERLNAAWSLQNKVRDLNTGKQLHKY